MYFVLVSDKMAVLVVWVIMAVAVLAVVLYLEMAEELLVVVVMTVAVSCIILSKYETIYFYIVC